MVALTTDYDRRGAALDADSLRRSASGKIEKPEPNTVPPGAYFGQLGQLDGPMPVRVLRMSETIPTVESETADTTLGGTLACRA